MEAIDLPTTAPVEGVSSFCCDVCAPPEQRHYNAGALNGFHWMRPFHPPVKPVDRVKVGLA
jgi:hypothetical protein